MKMISYGVRPTELEFFNRLNTFGYDLKLVPTLLNDDNVALAKGFDCVMLRGNCKADKVNLAKFKEYGVEYILTRTVGYNHVDLQAVKDLGFKLCASLLRRFLSWQCLWH